MDNLNKKDRPAVVFADNFFMTQKAIKEIEQFGEVIWANCNTEDEMVELLRKINPSVIVSEYFKISDRVLKSSNNLVGIVVWGVGYDHVNVNAASKRGIYVANCRGSNAESVAEHVVALILSLSRKLPKNDKFVRSGGWISREETGLPKDMMSQDLYGKTMGIIGFGAIGSRVARIALGFRMRILAYDPYVDANDIKEEIKLVDLKKLLTESDFVTLHTVLTEETKGLISNPELDLMKPTAYLINASRGPVINEKSLIDAISKEKIAGVGLDVFIKEPIDLSNPLLKFDNILVTPHCAGNSKEALEATSLMVSQETKRILQGQTPKNLVNKRQLARE
jgi:D-3-phosphoglycerate dehydrogenase